MKAYQKELALLLAESDAIFFQDGLTLKDGRPTPYFVNFGLFRTGKLISKLGSIMADFLYDNSETDEFDILLGPSYKGSSLAVTTVNALWEKYKINKLFDYDRKEAKKHGEATQKASKFVTGALHEGANIYIIDDVCTTMATKFELLDQLKAEGEAKNEAYLPKKVVLFMDRQQSTAVYDPNGIPILNSKGENPVQKFTQKTGIEVCSILNIRQTIAYLYDKKIPIRQNNISQLLSTETVDRFYDYLHIYGI